MLLLAGVASYQSTLAQNNPPTSTESGTWMVQVGSFGEEQNARRLADRVATLGLTARVFPSTSNGRSIFRVRVGPTSSHQSAAAVATFLSANGFDQPWVLNEPGQVVAYAAEPLPAPANIQTTTPSETITPVTRLETTTTPAPLVAQNQEKRIQINRANTAPTMDGRLDENIWLQAAVVDDLHQITPIEYAEPTEHTRVYLLYTDDALYVGVELLYEDPNQITAKVLRQGAMLFGDDMFAVILDPFHDRRSGYRFEVNANGIRSDLLFQNTNQRQQNWDGIWQAAAARNEQGWTAEMRIPFKTLSFDPRNDSWGINFMRWMPQKAEWIGWVSRNRNQNPSIAGTATGFNNLQQGLGLDIVPSFSLSEQKDYLPFANQSSSEPSLDMFYKLTPGLNASLTINTDFSATEVDDRQVDLSRFNLFFPEKRDFFLADSDIFEFGKIGGSTGFGSRTTFSRPSMENGRPFFSRRLGLSTSGEPVDLEYGGKLSGRIGRWNLGTMAIRQDAFEDVNATNVFVGRVSANVLSESSLGVFMTSGDPQSNLGNSLVGADFRYLNSQLPGGRALEGEAWYQQSDTEGLDGEDQAFGLRLQMPNSSGFRGGFGLKELQQNFNPALGFVNRKGIRDQTLELGYTRLPRDSLLRRVFSGVDIQRIDLLDGQLQTEMISVRPLELETNTRDRIHLRYTANTELITDLFEISEGVIIPPGEYSFDEYGFNMSTGNQRRISGTLNYRTGEYYSGDREYLRAALAWDPSTHFRTEVSYDFNDVKLPQGDFIVRLVTLKADIIFSSTLSWVNLIQYDNVSETAGINSRLHWIPEAGKEAFLVLNHNVQDLDRNDSFHSKNADMTFKVGYTFRF